jgi:transposase
VWNLALEQFTTAGRMGLRADLGSWDRQLAEARVGSWLGDGSSSVQQQALRDLRQALRSWWSGSHRRPTWRKGGVDEGFCVRDLSVRKVNRRWATVQVPKVGHVRFRLSRGLAEAATSARVTLDCAGRWHVSFTAPPEPRVAGPGTGEVVGVDRGVANTVALSTGELLSCSQPDWAKRRTLARRLSRHRRGSNRRARAKARLARLSGRETDRRKDWAEKVSTDLARRFDVVRVEDLNVRGMLRSAKGTVEAPGRNVRQKAGLSRAIAAQGWALFARRLGDKIGDRLEVVPAAYTSQTCSCCGHREQGNRESQAKFCCRACGFSEHADVNAARNIAAGRAVSGRGGFGTIGPPGETSSSAA